MLSAKGKIIKHVILTAVGISSAGRASALEIHTDEEAVKAMDTCSISVHPFDNLKWDFNDILEEFRTSGMPGDFEPEIQPESFQGCGDYEVTQVCENVRGGDIVSWLHWSGGGKYGYPCNIEWLDHAVDVVLSRQETKVTNFYRQKRPGEG